MTIRELADDPISYDHDGFKGIVADAADGRLSKLNADVTSAADLEKELQAVADEAADEVGKLAAAQKRFDDAVAAEADADGAEAQRAAQKEMRAAKTALDAAKAEYDIKEAEILAKLLDILQRAGLISGGTGTPLDDGGRDDQDPTKPKGSDKPDSPGDKPSDSHGDKPGDSPSSDSPSSPGQTKLSSDTSPTQQQPQQAQAQPQQAQQPSMSPSAGMPQQQQPNISPSAFNVRPRSDKDKDKPRDIDADRGVLPVATPVPAAVPIDRGSSVNGGLTTRDVSGKPSTSLSTAGQVPGSAAGQNPRGGMGGGGGMVGGGPLGAGSKSDTVGGKRGGKRFDLESLFTKPDNDDQRVSSGSLSKDSLAATEKAREDEKDRMMAAMRESAKRAMEKKAG